jgi:hypothetical protein
MLTNPRIRRNWLPGERRRKRGWKQSEDQAAKLILIVSRAPANPGSETEAFGGTKTKIMFIIN